MALIAADTLIGINAGAASPARAKLFEIMLGCDDTPADYAAGYKLQRVTTLGTRTAFTPEPFDDADAAAITVGGHTWTAEGTPDGNALLLISVNQRQAYRWVAQPGREIVVPATANYGLGLLCNAVSTQFTQDATLCFEE